MLIAVALFVWSHYMHREMMGDKENEQLLDKTDEDAKGNGLSPETEEALEQIWAELVTKQSPDLALAFAGLGAWPGQDLISRPCWHNQLATHGAPSRRSVPVLHIRRFKTCITRGTISRRRWCAGGSWMYS
jgi:hypothetical protein